MTIHNFFKLVNYFLALIAVVTFASSGDSQSLLTATNIFLFFALLLQMDLFLRVEQLVLKDLLLSLVVLNFLWIVFRLIVLLPMPHQFKYSYIVRLTPDDLSLTIVFVIFCNFMCFVGFKLGSMSSRSKQRPKEIHVLRSPVYTHIIPFRDSLFYLYIAMGLGLLSYYVLGVSRGSFSSHAYAVTQIVFSYEMPMVFFSSYIMVTWKNLSRRKRIFCFVTICLFVLFRTMVGGKGGLFQLLLYFFIGTIASQRLFVPKKILMLSIPLIFLSVMLYNFAYQVRMIGSHQFRGQQLNLYDFSHEIEKKSYDLSENLLWSISRRLSQLDYLIVMYNVTPTNPQSIGWSNALKVIVNILVPGNPFPDAILSARMFDVAYGSSYSMFVLRDYHSDMLPAYGHFYVLSGTIGLVTLLIISSAIFGRFYRSFLRRGDYFFARAATLFLFSSFLFGMGIDNLVHQLAFGLCLFILTIIALSKLIQFVTHFGHTRSLPVIKRT